MIKIKKVYQRLCSVALLYGIHVHAMNDGAIQLHNYTRHLYVFKTVIETSGMQATLLDHFAQSPQCMQNFSLVCKACKHYLEKLHKQQKINLPPLEDMDFFYWDGITSQEQREISEYGVSGWQQRILAKSMPVLPSYKKTWNVPYTHSYPPAIIVSQNSHCTTTFIDRSDYTSSIISEEEGRPLNTYYIGRKLDNDSIVVNELVRVLHESNSMEELAAAAASDKDIANLLQSPLINPNYRSNHNDVTMPSEIIDKYKGLYNKVVELALLWETQKTSRRTNSGFSTHK